jgi:predicted outer membrane repeat protein
VSARSLRRSRVRAIAAAHRREARRSKRATLFAGAALGATVLFAPSAQAAGPFVVDSTSDAAADGVCGVSAGDCTLRDAIGLANADPAADTITFAPGLSGSTIQLADGQGQINISRPVSIDGGTQNITVLAAASSRIFQVTTFDPVSITGLTLSNGNVEGSGGAISTNSHSNLTVTNSIISGNVASGEGGGISVGKYSSLKVTGSKVTGNTANQDGGGIYGDKYVSMDIQDSTISGNHSIVGDGGGISFGEFPEKSVVNDQTDGSVVIPPADPDPGLKVSRTTISGNDAENGGGIEVLALGYGDDVAVSQSTVSGNVATEVPRTDRLSSLSADAQPAPGSSSSGGGIDFPGVMAGPVSVSDSTVSGNAAGSGGGISFDFGYGENVPSLLRNRDSQADSLTGDGSVVIGNSTIAANSAINQGGGIYLGTYSTPNSDQVQQDNSRTSMTIPLSSTIVADNHAGATDTPNDVDRDDSSTGGGYKLTNSLIESPSADAALTQDPAGASIVGTDPSLGPLADNGGPTQTHLPSATSAALDVGLANGLSADQRLLSRTVDQTDIGNGPGDGTDIGAVEVAAIPIVLPDQPFDKIPTGCPILPAQAGKAFAGDDSAETIKGTTGNDILRGFGGTDDVIGDAGDDCLTGDDDADVIEGDAGDDLGQGGKDPDSMTAGDGDDRFGGGSGNDVIKLDAGDDTGIGGPDDDRVKGDDGDDLVRGRAGDDKVFGDEGNDDVKGGNNDDKVKGGAGSDKLHGGFGDDKVIGGTGKDKIDCGKGHDVAVASAEDTVSKDCETVKVVSG